MQGWWPPFLPGLRRRRRGPSSGRRVGGSSAQSGPGFRGGAALSPLVAGSSHLGLLLFFCSGNTINLLTERITSAFPSAEAGPPPPDPPQCWLVPQAPVPPFSPLRRHPRTKYHPRCLVASCASGPRSPATPRRPPSLVLPQGFLVSLWGVSIFTPGKFSFFHLSP